MNTYELCSRFAAVAAAACALLCAPLTASAEEATFEVALSGPDVGDPDGEATATVTLNAGTNQVDVQLRYANIAPPTALFIRVGALGTEGNVVMPIVIENAEDGRLTGRRTSAKAGLVETILAAPGDYYLIVMNDEYPIGALRGPLGE